LEILGLEVVTALNGRQAVEMITANPPDLLLLDLQMPGVSGYDIIRWLDKNPCYNYIKVIAITGYANAGHSPEAQMVDALLYKPLPIATLLEEVETLLAGAI
jgi:CheY-like chemotaxis protein